MKFKYLTIGLMLLTGCLISASASFAAERALVKGSDYEVVTPKGSKSAEVYEFFSYACGACYTMESFVTRFKKDNSEVKVIPVPTDLGHKQWQIYIKAYYLGELLDVVEQSHTKVFHRVNIEKKHLINDDDLKEFFVGLGVSAEKFDAANKSFSLNAKIRKAKQLVKKFRISGTPTFVVNQKYKLNNQALGTTAMIEKAIKELSSKN
jgi:protein dithiol oxidoreductase (disulfide-forming)